MRSPMKWFEIDYKRLVLLLLPTFLRRPRIYAFLTAMTFGVEELHRQFSRQRDANLLRCRRNGQVCYLRALLNDELDPVQRRITLEDASQPGNWLMIFDESTSYQTLIRSEPGTDSNFIPISNPISNPGAAVHILYDEAAILENTSFFTVTVPWNVQMEDSTNRLRSLLNEYKLLSKTYIINYTI